MTPETNPPQTDDVAQAIAKALAEAESAPDPWWQAGIEEALAE